jgi:FlgD Ig-like domain
MKTIITLILLSFAFVQSKAQIIYTDVNPDSVITVGNAYNLDLNNDGISDFQFYSNSAGSQGSCYVVNFGVTALNADSIILAEFALNEKIGDTTVWNHASSLNNLRKCYCQRNPDLGNYTRRCTGFAGSGDWYLPLKIVVNNLVYYGWVRLSESAFGLSLTIKDYAYNSIPNQPILAGEGGEGGPLPLTFISFGGVLKDNEAELTWATANETNNSGFDIERSRDGKNFIAIGFIKSKGNTSAETDYSFTDAALQAGINYYRLKQTDYDGNFKYSSVIKIAYTNGNANTITIAPNPFSNNTSISFTLPQSQKVSIQIFDIDGRLIKTIVNEQMQAGVHQLTWNATIENGTLVAKGMYYLRLNTGSYAETKKLSLIK